MPEQDTTTEMWKPVVGYEGLYDVSDLGRVRRVGPWWNNPKNFERVLKIRQNRTGYAVVELFHNGKRLHRTIHHLVSDAFIGQRPEGYQVNHKDGDKLHNFPSNLEYVTDKENHEHAARIGLKACGERHGSSVLTVDDVRKIRALRNRGQTLWGIGDLFHISATHVSNICARRAWKTVT